MRSLCVGAAVACALLTGALPAHSEELTIDEARAVAEQAMGVSLSGAKVETRATTYADTLAIFELPPRGGRCSMYFVGLRSGRFLGYSVPRPSSHATDRAALTTEEALQVAKTEALTRMGDVAAKFEWQTHDSSPGYVEVAGIAPPVGDPPHLGLEPFCWVRVDRASGTVCSYRQYWPLRPDPVAPKVPREEAVRTAIKEFGEPDARTGEVTLHQPAGVPIWHVPVQSAHWPEQTYTGDDGIVYHAGSDPRSCVYRVDALTGEIVGADTYEGAAAERLAEGVPEPSAASVIASAGPAPKAGGRPAVPVVPVAGAGVVLVLAVGALVVIRRRK